ncbi:MAG: hypothetical protein E7127_02860 [Rikenellaceae bacterium]|nr:hypothetical protein [Rikenellaceae bacterium]
MKKLLNFSLAIIAVAFVACSYEDVALSTNESPSNPYEVTPDEAVQLLQTVMGGESTRAISVGSIQTLRKSDFVPSTRGAEDGDVVYIVDLENGGSAIMGADKRMEPIYAILDETKISPEQLTLTATRSDDGEQDIEEYVMGLVNDKITYDMSEMIPIVRDSLLPEMPMIPRPHEVTMTTMLGSKYPMLRTKWHQRSPYNDNYPRGEGPYFEDGVMLAGCGPIAVAQVLYFLRTPNSWSGVSNYFNWDLISECEYQGEFSDNACSEVAKFVSQISGKICREKWHSEQYVNPGVEPENLIYDLEDFGLEVDSLGEYNFDLIKTLLNDDLPVITRGEFYNQYTGTFKHMWVIDGYKSHRESTYLREYFGEGPRDYTDTFISSTDYNLVHCNYGWNGDCDGYYSSGVFDVRTRLEDDMIIDEVGDVASSKLYNFEIDLKYIHYSYE